MAMIDKIYVNTLEEYREFRNWCEGVKDSCFLFYTGLDILKYFYHETEGEFLDVLNQFGDDIPITNFPRKIDEYLIHHCPIDWVQGVLKYQYSTDYELIKSTPDCYKKSIEYIPATKVKIIFNNLGRQFCSYKCGWWRSRKSRKIEMSWWIQLEGDDGENWRYDLKNDRWIDVSRESTSNRFTSNGARKCRSIKGLIRQLIKWKLPKGIKIYANTPYMYEQVQLVTK